MRFLRAGIATDSNGEASETCLFGSYETTKRVIMLSRDLRLLTSTLSAFFTKKSVKIYLVYLITYAILNYLY